LDRPTRISVHMAMCPKVSMEVVTSSAAYSQMKVLPIWTRWPP
jgi:hypothetical protein